MKSYSAPPADDDRSAQHSYSAKIETERRHADRRAVRRRCAEDGQQLRLPCPRGLLRRGDLPPRHQGLHDPGRRSRPAPAAAAPATIRRRAGQASYERGILAMANAGRNTNGSQFFVMHADYRLPPNYTIFGRLTVGEDVLDKIATAARPAPTTGRTSRRDQQHRDNRGVARSQTWHSPTTERALLKMRVAASWRRSPRDGTSAACSVRVRAPTQTPTRPSSTRRSMTSPSRSPTRTSWRACATSLRDRRVTLLVDRWSEDWSELEWLRLEGRARLLDPDDAPAQHAAAVALLRARYPQYTGRPLETLAAAEDRDRGHALLVGTT